MTHRIPGALAAIALHALVLAALLSYEPARSALFAATPIMVDWIVPRQPEQPKLEPPAEPPKPRPARNAQRRIEPQPLLAAPAESPAPIVAPAPLAPPPAPEPIAAAPASKPEPLAIVPPVFNADYLQNPDPVYPPLSRRLGEQGRVILRVLVNAQGGADEVQVLASSGYARLDEAARDKVKRWRFVPARRGADPVPAWVRVPISFRLEG